MMYRIGFLLCLSLAACAPPGGVRVGWVDGARLIRQSRTGKAIRAKVAAESDRLTRELEQLQRRVASRSKRLQQLRKTLPASDLRRQKAESALERETLELRRTHVRYRDQLNAYGRRLLRTFTERIRRIARALRRERGLDLVVMTSRGDDQGLWCWPVTDITDAVLSRLDSEQERRSPRPTR